MVDARDFTVESLTAAYASGDMSPVEATQLCLQRIAEQDSVLNAFVFVDQAGALESAHASAARWRDGHPLSAIDGVPTSVKDLVAVKGWPLRKGSPHTDANAIVTENSPVADRLEEAGAVVVGVTTTPEFGWKGVGDSPLTGITRNPWNPELGPGGSSAGAAVAAATGMAVLNVGTDGGGSIRMPAAFCGVFGLKPTLAIIPMFPPGGSGLLSHLGPLTATVRDSAVMMSVLAQPDHREVYPTLRDERSWTDALDDGVAGLKIAYSPEFERADVDPEIAYAVRGTVDLLAYLGAEITQIAPPLPDCRDAFLTLWDAALGRSLADVPAELLGQSDPGLVDTLARGERLSAFDFLAANSVRDAATVALGRLLNTYDVVVSPQLPITAFPVGRDVADPHTQQHWVDWTPFTYPINLTRNPAASVPVGLSSRGLPMAMQIVGRHYDDRLVLRVARSIERERPFARIASA